MRKAPPKVNEPRQPNASVRIGKVALPISGLRCAASVDSLPRLSFDTNLANIRTLATGDAELLSAGISTTALLNKALQEKLLTNFAAASDVAAQLEDGSGNVLEFKGRFTSPTSAVDVNSINITLQAMHQAMILQAFVPQVYSRPEFYALESDNSAQVSVAGRCLAILTEMRKNYSVKAYEFEKEEYAEILRTNDTVWPYVEAFLKKSIDYTRLNQFDNVINDENLTNTIRSIILNSPNFTAVIYALCGNFFLQWVNQWNGDSRLEHNQCLTVPGDRVIRLPVPSVSFRCGSDTELPIIQIVMQGDGGKMYGLDGMNGPSMAPGAGGIQPSYVTARYPEKLKAGIVGRTVLMQAPNWLNTVEIKASDHDYSEDTSPAAVVAQQRHVQDLADNSREATRKVLADLAKTVFFNQFFATSEGSCVYDMNVLPEIGRTYRVESVDEKLLFSGYLREIKHTLMLGDKPQANTALIFSHVMAPGLDLSGMVG